MSTDAHHRRSPHAAANAARAGVARIAPSLFARSNPFVDLLWEADSRGLCMSYGCTDCGALGFRRELARLEGEPDDAPLNAPVRDAEAPPAPAGPLALALAAIDFDQLRLAPHWHDALAIALLRLRERGQLAAVIDAWVRRETIPVRVLDLVLLRHARYGFPDERLSDLWIERCLDAIATTQDEGLVETMILSCPERIGADPRAYRAAAETAQRSACVRSLMGRLGECA